GVAYAVGGAAAGGGGGGGGGAASHDGAGGGGPEGGATAACVNGVPHAWQNWLPSGFWAPHLAQVIAIYLRASSPRAPARWAVKDKGPTRAFNRRGNYLFTGEW